MVIFSPSSFIKTDAFEMMKCFVLILSKKSILCWANIRCKVTASKASSFAGLQNPIYNWRPKETPALNSQFFICLSVIYRCFCVRCIKLLALKHFFFSLVEIPKLSIMKQLNGNRIAQNDGEKRMIPRQQQILNVKMCWECS